MLMPGGLGATFGDARDGVLRWYARRKGIRVPSLRRRHARAKPPIESADLDGAVADAATRGEVETVAGDPRVTGRDRRRQAADGVVHRSAGSRSTCRAQPRRFFEEMSGGQALFPLIVLVGLNCVNQLDQTAFGVLGPDIRDVVQPLEPGASSRSSRSRQLGGLLLAVPLAYYSDRLQRVAIAVVGAAVWARVRHRHRSLGHRAHARDRALGRRASGGR